jgi:hypothetical protein
VEVRVCEINARVTGATYPSVLARHFGTSHGAWLMRNLAFGDQGVESQELMDLLRRSVPLIHRHATDQRGIIPVNFNLTPEDRVHKGQFLCLAPTTVECVDLLHGLQQALPVESSHARD